MTHHPRQSPAQKPGRHWRVMCVIEIPLASRSQASVEKIWEKDDALGLTLNDALTLVREVFWKELPNYEALCTYEREQAPGNEERLFAYRLEVRRWGTWRLVQEVSDIFDELTTPTVTHDSR